MQQSIMQHCNFLLRNITAMQKAAREQTQELNKQQTYSNANAKKIQHKTSCLFGYAQGTLQILMTQP
jgi:hypothetical protein